MHVASLLVEFDFISVHSKKRRRYTLWSHFTGKTGCHFFVNRHIYHLAVCAGQRLRAVWPASLPWGRTGCQAGVAGLWFHQRFNWRKIRFQASLRAQAPDSFWLSAGGSQLLEATWPLTIWQQLASSRPARDSLALVCHK